jgi:hypothetical protein
MEPAMFKKGEVLNLVGSWNGKATWYVRRVIVGSCGKVRMHLIDAQTGETVGREFVPARDQLAGWKGAPTQFVTRATGEDLMTEVLAAAEAVRAKEAWMARRQLELAHERGKTNTSWVRHIQISLDEALARPAPRVDSYETLAAEVEAAVRAGVR